MQKIKERTRTLFQPTSKEPFKLSRTKLELSLECPRCFYLDRRQGIERPRGPPFTLNLTVDALLKREFDVHRARGTRHPLMEEYAINAVPFPHQDLSLWRDNFHGVQVLHPRTNFLVFGAVDDVWTDREGGLFVVDYKATSTERVITLDDAWKGVYKRQMEIYQWLLRGNSFKVRDTGYFVYVNARKDRDCFEGRLECSLQILPYVGKDDWVESALEEAHWTLLRETPPPPAAECPWCTYQRSGGILYAHGEVAEWSKAPHC